MNITNNIRQYVSMGPSVVLNGIYIYISLISDVLRLKNSGRVISMDIWYILDILFNYLASLEHSVDLLHSNIALVADLKTSHIQVLSDDIYIFQIENISQRSTELNNVVYSSLFYHQRNIFSARVNSKLISIANKQRKIWICSQNSYILTKVKRKKISGLH